jgi:putative transport protein
MYSGSLTNTPALAGVVEYLRNNAPASIDVATLDAKLAEPVIGYSIAYPMGVIAVIIAILVMKRLWRVDFAAEADKLQSLGGTSWHLENRTVLVTRKDPGIETLKEIINRFGCEVNFGRIKRNGELSWLHQMRADARRYGQPCRHNRGRGSGDRLSRGDC